MIIKNNKGKQKEVKILLEIQKSDEKYIIYKDIDTSNIYASRYLNGILHQLEKSEYEFLNKILKELND